MGNPESVVEVTFFSDILCVWAHIGQMRLDELVHAHREEVDVRPRFMAVYGDVYARIERGWSERGGLQGYNAHIQEVSAKFPEIETHPECFTLDTPSSSLPAHLCLSAVRLIETAGEAEAGTLYRAMRTMRDAFFVHAKNIAKRAVLDELLEAQGLSVDRVRSLCDDGSAFAALSSDMELMRNQDVRMSPTFAFNEWRQRLQGNVGYRLLEANVKELLERPGGGASWC